MENDPCWPPLPLKWNFPLFFNPSLIRKALKNPLHIFGHNAVHCTFCSAKNQQYLGFYSKVFNPNSGGLGLFSPNFCITAIIITLASTFHEKVLKNWNLGLKIMLLWPLVLEAEDFQIKVRKTPKKHNIRK